MPAQTRQPTNRVGAAEDEHQEYPTAKPHILLRSTTAPSIFADAVWGRVFNRRRDSSPSKDRSPAAVVNASSIAHIREAVELAKDWNCRVSVRSGGHSWAAWSVRRDAVLVDLKDLYRNDDGENEEGEGKGEGKEKDGRIVYDEDSGIVACAPAVTGEELNGFLEGYGRMFAGGHCPDVGLGGFLLQGGMGWNCKNWGWACESIVGVDVVTADARELHCSADENSDLFWAARGAGPGFPAIVTRFHLSTRPLLNMYNSVYIYPRSMFRTVLQWVIDICPTADPDTEVVCLAKHTADGNEIEIIAGFLSFKSCRKEAVKAMQRVHDSRPAGAKIEVSCDPTDFACQYAGQREEQPTGYRFCSDNGYIDNNVADVPGVVEQTFTSLPTQKTFVLYFAMNPTSRRPLPDMAHSMHSDHYVSVYAIWDDAADDERCTGWVRDAVQDMARHSVGSYMGDADFQQRTTRFWSKEHGERLQNIRQKWDPDGRVCGYLDVGDRSGVQGLRNEFEWAEGADGPWAALQCGLIIRQEGRL
ncbi:FAD-binding domain-containing protein [Nemania sp. FL0916]|nr:FAD-binding domain-containing protein [Nemania sp. FL0916]